ncbi:LysE family translocator [Chitinimonas taiwanensis]|uniref:Threonine/homoserine/homoserine lactone efflux protein n=1 Tax=Chitinimonas taiwanensis DSM 18899 TaxID=1121279 RepID=A0A1K2HD47_9NEIS|nr:LysE family translocator [Chitinimonas taiwanensis]SFZ74694.1 Threonine/homoserine/homoserine lactone efflux protein [Chitinimonas taiwanensis DSM 18899]
MLLDAPQALGFLGAALLLTLAPGPDNLLVLSLGAARGRLAGMLFGLGCALGCLSHTLLAMLGISALLAASPLAFGLLRLAGGAYLIYLGWMALRSSGGAAPQASQSEDSLRQLFLRGLIANAINPKVVLFFLSFLPQFVQPARVDGTLQIAQLGLLFTLQAALLFSLLGYFAGQVGEWLKAKRQRGLWLDRLAGGVLLALGLRLLLLG